MQGVEIAGESGRTFVSINELARTLGVTPGPVSRRVARLEGQGLLETRMDGQRKLVDLEAYMATKAVAEDGVRAANGRLARGGAAADADAEPALSVQQARKARIQADLAQIQLDKARGRLLEAADVEEAMATAAGRLARGLDALVTKADEFAAVVARDGVQGLRTALKAYARELRERLASDMTAAEAGEEE